ncbi:MAG: hypothetical protein SGI92_23255 [Bryobacteraceae bacterium]|nr:hypothetical protein [Bryobacteraceae bacterium]
MRRTANANRQRRMEIGIKGHDDEAALASVLNDCFVQRFRHPQLAHAEAVRMTVEVPGSAPAHSRDSDFPGLVIEVRRRKRQHLSKIIRIQRSARLRSTRRCLAKPLLNRIEYWHKPTCGEYYGRAFRRIGDYTATAC